MTRAASQSETLVSGTSAWDLVSVSGHRGQEVGFGGAADRGRRPPRETRPRSSYPGLSAALSATPPRARTRSQLVRPSVHVMRGGAEW